MSEIALKYYADVDTWIIEYEYGKTRAATEQEVELWKQLAALEQERDRLKDLVDWYKSLLGFHGHSLDDQISNSGKHIVDKIRELESALGGEGKKGGRNG